VEAANVVHLTVTKRPVIFNNEAYDVRCNVRLVTVSYIQMETLWASWVHSYICLSDLPCRVTHDLSHSSWNF